MLIAAPKEILGKFGYRNGKPTATCELTDEEQKVFDKFCEDFEELQRSRFGDDTEED